MRERAQPWRLVDHQEETQEKQERPEGSWLDHERNDNRENQEEPVSRLISKME